MQSSKRENNFLEILYSKNQLQQRTQAAFWYHNKLIKEVVVLYTAQVSSLLSLLSKLSEPYLFENTIYQYTCQ